MAITFSAWWLLLEQLLNEHEENAAGERDAVLEYAWFYGILTRSE